MPEQVKDKKVFSLLEVTQSIQRTLAKRYGGAFWVKAEMNKLNHYPHSGHCYPELVEKKNGKVIAQLRSNLWRGDYHRVNENFLKVLKEPLKDGIEILFCAKVSFSPNHGLSLNIIDIDPGYTLGALEKEKFETIEQLKKEGIYSNNKQLQLPLLPQRLAIISVQTSKGYADFTKVIDGNTWGYKYFHMLFPALLQGDHAVPSIIKQLRRIKKVHHHFDLVAIIRGGGGDIGLTCYNHYDLAKELALFPIPVLTGIGHATNETVAEMIAHQNAITPTELADFLLQKFHDFSNPVQDSRRTITDFALKVIGEQQVQFQHAVKYVVRSTGNLLQTAHSSIDQLSKSMLSRSALAFRRERESLNDLNKNIARGTSVFVNSRSVEMHTQIASLQKASKSAAESARNEITNLEKVVSVLHPENVLKRGYSITLKNGKAVRNFLEAEIGDEIETRLFKGKISSTVKGTKSETK